MKTESAGKCICYAVQQGPGGPIKIGITHDLKKRHENLQNGSPVRLVVLGTWPGSRSLEKQIHRELKAHRMSGEWFRPAKEVVALVSRHVGRNVEAGQQAEPLQTSTKIIALRDAIIDYVRKNDYVTFAELVNRSVLDRGNESLMSERIDGLVYWAGLSSDSVHALIHALNSGSVVRQPADILSYAIDGALLDLPILKSIPPHNWLPVDHWLPIYLRPAAAKPGAPC